MLCPQTKDEFSAWNGGRFLGSTQHTPVELADGTLLAAAGREKNGQQRTPAVVVIPPDNYTGDRPGGTPWKVTVPKLTRPAHLPGFLTLDKDRTRLALLCPLPDRLQTVALQLLAANRPRGGT